VHGVQVSPGKPTILAERGNAHVFGLPGQVTSAQVVMAVFGIPFLRHLAGDEAAFERRFPETRQARLARNLASKQGREDWVRVRLEREDDGWLAVPRLGKSGLMRTMIEADGLVRIPENEEGLLAGDEIRVYIFA
jgi:molybdopterin molybdotransferase